jgi:hypothetical protein
MRSRVEAHALTLLGSKSAISKYDLAKSAPCDQRTAQRILKRLHERKVVVIVAWVYHYHKHIPKYGEGEKDKRKPKPLTRKQISRRYNADPENSWNRMMKRRAQRLILKHSRKDHEHQRQSTIPSTANITGIED